MEELLTFVRNPKSLRPEAEPGAHDDTVLALAICWQARGQQDSQEALAEEAMVEWTEDMWEDYEGADEAGRQYLLAKWGRPKK